MDNEINKWLYDILQSIIDMKENPRYLKNIFQISKQKERLREI